MLDSRPKGRGFEPHRRHCVVSLSKNINPSLVLVQPRKTRPFITERLLMGRKESNQTKQNHYTGKKDFQESTPKIQMLMFGLAQTSHFRLWDIIPPEFQLAFHIYYVKYENTLTCKKISWNSGGGMIF